MSTANDNTQVLPSITSQVEGDILADRFQLVRLLGNGANGSVFLATDLHLRCQVAVKIIRSGQFSTAEHIDKLRQEILLARSITHPNVIRVYEFYLSEQCVFFTMDYINGVTLANFELPNDSTRGDIAQSLGVQLIEAVTAIHEQGILHCDIKPENILIDNKNRLYLSDLGLAAALSAVTHQSCTPCYSAPEVLQRCSHSRQSDFYSVALSLFQLLTNTLAFNQIELAAQLKAKLHNQWPEDEVSKAFPKWQAFFKKNLAAHPQQRSASAEELKALWLTPLPAKARTRGIFPIVMMMAAVFIAIALWQVPWQPDLSPLTQEVAAVPVSIAIMPSESLAETISQQAIARLVQQVMFEQLRKEQVRLIDVERVQTTLQHLGLTIPLNNRQLQDVASLLGVELILSSQITVLGTDVEFSTALHDMRKPLAPVIWSERITAPQQRLSFDIGVQINQMLSLISSTKVESRGSRPIPEEAQQLYSLLLIARANNDVNQITQLLTQLQQKFPELALGYLLMAEWYQQQHDWLMAERYYTLTVTKALPGSFDYLLSNARLAWLQEKYSSADEHYLKLLQQKTFDTALIMEYVAFLSEQNRFEEGISQLQLLASTDKTNPDIYLELGKLAIRSGDVKRAADEYLLQAQVLYKRLKHQAGLADSLNASGVALQRMGMFTDAIAQYEQALDIFTDLNDRAGMAKAASNLGLMQLFIGSSTEADVNLNKAIHYFRDLNDQSGLARTLDYRGMLAEEIGEYKQALNYYNEAFSLRSKLNANWEITESLNNLGYIYFVLSDFDRSMVYLKQAEQNAMANNDVLSLIRVRQSLAQLRMQQGEWGQAYRLFKKTSEDSKAIDLSSELLIADAFLAKLSALQGNFELAERQLLNAIEQASSDEDWRVAIEFSLWLIEIYQNSAQYDKAGHHLSVLQDGKLKPSNNEQKQTLHLLHAYQFIGLGQLAEAGQQIAILQQALQNQPLVRLALKAFLAEQQLLFLQGKPLAHLSDEFSTVLGHHATERLMWFELQALTALAQGDLELVNQLVNQAMPLLRRVTSYWRNFTFAFLQQGLDLNFDSDSAVNVADTAEFQRLLQNIPEPYKQVFVQRENTMMNSGYVKE